MSVDSPSVTRRAKELLDKGAKPGEALRRARYELAPHLMTDEERLTEHVGKRVQFAFHRQLLLGTLVHYDPHFKKVVITYQLNGSDCEFRSSLKNLGKIGYIKD